MLYSKIAGLCTISLILLIGCAQSAEGKPQGLPEGVAISTIELSHDFPDDRTLFVGTEKGRVLRSVDAGLTWMEGELDTEPAYAVLDIAASPNFAQGGAVYLGAAAGLYRSVDGGSTWNLLHDTPFNYTLEVMVSPDYETDHTLLVTASEGYHGNRLDLYLSTDKGNSWSGGPSPSVFGKPRYVEFLPDGSLIGAARGLLDRSLDFGETWEPLYTSDVITGSFSVSPNLLEEDGVAFFADHVAGGRGLHRVVLEEWPPVAVYSVGGAISQEICRRQGYGAFCPFPPVFSPTFGEDGTVFAAGRMRVTDTQARLVKSVDRGITWETVFLPTSERVIFIAISPDYSENQTLYVATRHSLFASKNGGDDWEQLASMLVEEDSP